MEQKSLQFAFRQCTLLFIHAFKSLEAPLNVKIQGFVTACVYAYIYRESLPGKLLDYYTAFYNLQQ
jgi:hypothetical protein